MTDDYEENEDGGIIGALIAADFAAQLAPLKYFGGEYLKSSGELSEAFPEEDLPTLALEYDEGVGQVTAEIRLPEGMYICVVQDGVVAVLEADPVIEIRSEEFFAATRRLENKESGEWQ